jgi:hypothetical protein
MSDGGRGSGGAVRGGGGGGYNRVWFRAGGSGAGQIPDWGRQVDGSRPVAGT